MYFRGYILEEEVSNGENLGEVCENNEVNIQRNGMRKMLPAESNHKSNQTQTPNKPSMNVRNHLLEDFNDPKSTLKNSISDFQNGKTLLN